jgi:phosphoglycerate dehydrogenase-like enzyme
MPLKESCIAIFQNLKDLKWVHSLSVGVNNIICDELINSDIILTNSKGSFNIALSEWVMTSIL